MTQNRTILKHLLRHGSITGVEAQGVYRVRSLTSRIAELKHKHGVNIQSLRGKDMTGQQYVKYVFKGNRQQALKIVYGV